MQETAAKNFFIFFS